MKFPLLRIVYRERRHFPDNGTRKDVCENKEIIHFIHAHYLKCTHGGDYCANRELFLGEKCALTYQQNESNFTEVSSVNVTVREKRII